MKNFIILLLLTVSVIILGENITKDKFNKEINNILSLRILGVASDNIWNVLGINKNIDVYFNDYNNKLYECKNFLIDNNNCTPITINDDIVYHIKDIEDIDGYAYIFNNTQDITKENSIILAKNYPIDDDCTDNQNNYNNIVTNITALYNKWKNKNYINDNYKKLQRKLQWNLFATNSDLDILRTQGTSEYLSFIPYDTTRMLITFKILNNLNISFDTDNEVFHNNNSDTDTDFSCELHKVMGIVAEDSVCGLENTFANPDNILNFEQRVLYQKPKPKEKTDYYFDEETQTIKLKDNSGNINVIGNIGNIFPTLTDNWSDDFVVNAYILKEASNIPDLGKPFNILYNPKNDTARNLYELVSKLIYKTFKFYEDKTKARAKIKQLMELKSIGLLTEYRWSELGFNSYKNDAKSEIKVNDFLELYDNFYQQDLNTITEDNYKKIFEDSGYNSLFLAYLLKKLNLKMINGKILNNYDVKYIEKLTEIKDYNTYLDYKNYLLSEKDDVLDGLSENNKEYLPLFFKLKTLNKLIKVLKTDGFKKTIPQFKIWLEYQSENGLYTDIYDGFSYDYIKLIEQVLENNNNEEYLDSTRKELVETYYQLLKDIGQNSNLKELMKIYSILENIDITTRDVDDSIADNQELLYLYLSRKKTYLTNLKEISLTEFQSMVLTNKNIFYENKTNLYYIYNEYKENTTKISDNNGLRDLLKNTIIITNNSDDVFQTINAYANISYKLSSLLIEDRHKANEIAGEIIKNLMLLDKEGIKFENWMEDLKGEYDKDSNDIWEFLGIRRDALLTEKGKREIVVDDVISKYYSLNDTIKGLIGIREGYSGDYNLSSDTFDSITALLLSKVLVDRGYYIDKDENGNDAIFDNNGNLVYLSLEVNGLISEIRNKYNNFNNDFNSLFNNTYLNDYLGNNHSTDLNKMMGFIKFAYTKDLRTGERNISFSFTMEHVANDILWSRINSIIGSRAGLWEPIVNTGRSVVEYLFEKVFTKTTAKYLGDKVIGGIIGGVIGMGLSLFFMDTSDIDKQIQYERDFFNGKYFSNSMYIINMHTTEIEDVELSRIITMDTDEYNVLLSEIDGYLDEGFDNDTIIQLFNDKLENSKKKRNALIHKFNNTQEKLNTLKNKKNKDQKDNAEIKRLEQKQKLLSEKIKKAEKKVKKAQKNLDAVKKSNVIEKEREKKNKEKKEKSKPSKMCRPEAYNKECDTGVGPAGNPKIVLSKLGSIGKRLLEEISKQIVNMPIQECNIITRVCGKNTIEINANELQIMIQSIEAELASDDGACKWSPLNDCSYFDSNGQSRPSYFDLLWDPLPPFVEQ